MTPDRIQQIEALYHAVREASVAEKTALLEGADPELRREVESLLARQKDRLILDRTAQFPDEPTVTVWEAGARLGPYQVESKIGEGGMGEVFRAVDTRLGRPVAIKLAHEQFTDRFEREARAISSLNHPNICTLYDIGPNYLVMELLEGETIAARLKKGPLPAEQILRYAVQIAGALAEAHEHGIVHRDLKPGNIMLTKSGVKVLDFGLATWDGDDSLTGSRMVLGTPAYMSPEQREGKPADARSDVYSFGCVLYEMLTGKRATTGVRPVSPRTLEKVVARCLAIDPGQRWQTAAELARALERAPGVKKHRIGIIPAAAALVTLLAGVGLAWRLLAPRQAVTSTSEYIQLTNFSDSATAPALSSDGRMLAFFRGGDYFLGDGQVWVKMLPDGESRQLTNDPNVKYDPVFSPDGSRVAYSEVFTASKGYETWTVPVLGGPPSRLMANAAGLSWIGPDRLLFSEIMPGSVVHMGVVTAKESRAEERAIYFPGHERAMAHYSWLSPDRNSVLLVEMDAAEAWQRCRVVPVDGKSMGIQVGPEGACTAGAWSPDGRWVYLNVNVAGSSHLWRQRWRNDAPDGNPEQITLGPTEEEGLAVAPDGKSLIASVGVRLSSVWAHDGSGDRMVSVEGLASVAALSADGKRLYYLLQKNNQSDAKDLWQGDLVSGKSIPVLPGLRIVDYDISRDETLVAFTVAGPAGEKEIFVASPDRSTPPRMIFRGGDSVSFGADGQLIFRQLGGKANFLERIHTDGSGLERILDSPIVSKSGASPDGEWVLVGGVGGLRGMSGVSVKGRVGRQICNTRCDGKWSPDGKYLYLTVGQPTRSRGRTFILPVPRGAGLPDLPVIQVTGPSGARSLRQMMVAPGPDPEAYAFTKSEFKGNLFRIPLH